MSEYPRVPAAFINAIAEDGDKAEALEWLQKTWDELCYVRKQRDSLIEQLFRAEEHHQEHHIKEKNDGQAR